MQNWKVHHSIPFPLFLSAFIMIIHGNVKCGEETEKKTGRERVEKSVEASHVSHVGWGR